MPDTAFDLRHLRYASADSAGLGGGGQQHVFHEKTKVAYCVIATGGRRFYGCFLFSEVHRAGRAVIMTWMAGPSPR